MYYPCGENKGADQLRSYCEADLRLCFRLCKLLVFPCSGLNHNMLQYHTHLQAAAVSTKGSTMEPVTSGRMDVITTVRVRTDKQDTTDALIGVYTL